MCAVRRCSVKGGSRSNRRFGVSDALADPIVQALMAADRVDPGSVAALMRRMAVRPANRSPWGLRSPATCDSRG
jgi:hypothetical protein